MRRRSPSTQTGEPRRNMPDPIATAHRTAERYRLLAEVSRAEKSAAYLTVARWWEDRARELEERFLTRHPVTEGPRRIRTSGKEEPDVC